MFPLLRRALTLYGKPGHIRHLASGRGIAARLALHMYLVFGTALVLGDSNLLSKGLVRFYDWDDWE